MKISASFLTIDNIDNVNKLVDCDIDYLHLDIMDGMFVNNKNEVVNINNKKPLDVHLMVNDVYKYIDIYKNLNPLFITFHYEAVTDVLEVVNYIKKFNIKVGLSVNYIKKFNIKVGLSIKPSTKVEEIIPYLPYLDLILVMSVEPGQGGQSFIMDTVDKIKKLKELKGNYLIEVDGGINDNTINLVSDADIIVVGSYITSGDYEERIRNLKEKIYG